MTAIQAIEAAQDRIIRAGRFISETDPVAIMVIANDIFREAAKSQVRIRTASGL
jgi:hypothetical protein